MQNNKYTSISRPLCGLLTVVVLAALPLLPSLSQGADLIDFARCDVRVLYVYNDVRTIDWPTLYYLNDEHACRIDLVTLETHTQFHASTKALPNREIYLHHLYVPDDSGAMGMVAAELFEERRPDLVLFAPRGDNVVGDSLRRFLIALPPSDSLLFNILKIYEQCDEEVDLSEQLNLVVLNVREAARRHRERMDREIPKLIGREYQSTIGSRILSHYRPVLTRLTNADTERGFLAGIESFRLEEIIDSLETNGPRKSTWLTQTRRFLLDFAEAARAEGQERVDRLVGGYSSLLELETATESSSRVLGAYVARVIGRAERAALDALGVSWEGRISLRDSPQGPIAKVTLEVSVDGPSDVSLTSVEFQPSREATPTQLDSVPRTIAPHQSYVREYAVHVDPEQLAAGRMDSLVFTTVVEYGRTALRLSHSLPLREIPKLSVRFDPGFIFIPPVAKLEVDRIVSSMVWNVVITKPPDLAGEVHIQLETPRGVFAGAYRTDLDLVAGTIRRMVRIPFSVSNLFEQGIHYPTVSLVVDGQVAAADTGRMRIAKCEVGDSRSIGFLPDSSGLLEDCLNMTEAAVRPLTRRGLMTANLSAYQVIVIGSGTAASYPELPDARDRLEEYVRGGGSLVVLGQDYSWPRGVLPFIVTPSPETIDASDVDVRMADARILNRPQQVVIEDLLAGIGRRREAAAAVVSPSEVALAAGDGAALLSVSRLGEGQMIYCGLPLLELVAELNLESIHLFANILNY